MTTSKKTGSLYAMFKTNKTAEENGVDINYGEAVITIARAGGANTAFSRRMEVLFKPYRRQIQTDTMPKEQMEELTKQAFCETVILGWKNVYDENGNDIAFSVEAAIQVMTDLPDLYADLFELASKTAIFREDTLEADAKN